MKNRPNYTQSYSDYWASKGSYGLERLRRTLERKRSRYEKRKMYENTRVFFRDGKYWQKCSYDAWGWCESPCNGDC